MGEYYSFKALHFENQEPQMNADERRFIVTGNTDDADLTDFRGYEIRVYPRHPRNPRSMKGAQHLSLLKYQFPGADMFPAHR